MEAFRRSRSQLEGNDGNNGRKANLGRFLRKCNRERRGNAVFGRYEFGHTFRGEVAFIATYSRLFAMAVPVPLYINGNGTVARRDKKNTRTKRLA